MDDDVNAPLHPFEELLTELEALLKSAEMGATLAARGVNVSLALVATEGLRAYLQGDKERAAEEFDTIAEEIATRLEASKDLAKEKPS
jgi:hypothetical protein